ncbi:GIY-YIG nuclease family protein [Mycobacterium sp. CBMA271]|uniref:GIY-YIG nuclease family protein n=1 Tax=unclassified Mycobacteroides TaxID=2618759 RepID=UPI0012DD766D|nr:MULTISPECIES: GIY-YIG nuclease family protein [unclassified Mycobacteroides]MUM17875.1 hypothetical protein [Mycobacteroides sp. CBMA 326]MUM20445.1 GIY-YIG nuclease family protein [Mycobacteroides sp. CBMA 271]
MHNCTISKAAPGEPKGGIYVVTNPKGQDVYAGKATDIEAHVKQQVRGGEKVKPVDTVRVEHQPIRDAGTLNPKGSVRLICAPRELVAN